MADPTSLLSSAAPSSAPNSFSQKLIEIVVQLAPDPVTNAPRFFSQGTSGLPNSNTVTLRGSRTSVRIQNAGMPKGSHAQVDIYGLATSAMNELSTLGMVFQLTPKNVVTIKAGTAESGLAVVFVGTVVYAYGDFNKAPDVPFHFELVTGQTDAVISVQALSYPQPTDVGVIMSSLAKIMNLGFENNGVGPGNTFGVVLPPSYLSGSARDMVKKVAADAGIIADPDVRGAENINVLAIWPKGGARKLVVPLVSPTTGMIGYPSVSQGFLDVKTIFNPQIGLGGQIALQTSLKTQGLAAAIDSTWNVVKLDHALDAQVHGGLWETSLWCFNPKYQQPNPPV